MKIWNDSRHLDTVPKRRITEEDIEILKYIQKEMNEQDSFGQADPIFWVIEGSERVWGNENGYPCLVADDDTDNIWEDLEAVHKTIDGIQKAKGADCYAVLSNADGYIEVCENGEETDTIFDMEDAAMWLREHGVAVRLTTYEDTSKVYPSTMFITYKDACDHLKANYYHYSEDAHPFAMTAWRDPTVARLYKIIQEIDWNSLGGGAKNE